ncbi:MAG: pitrilysin family protein [Chthonomonadales bacterium]
MRNQNAIWLAGISLAAFSACAIAQDSGGVKAPEGTKGTIFKGKAPVSKDLLKVKFPRPKEFKLPNGVRIFVLEDHRLPTVRISVGMKAGALIEPKPGVAEYTASMMNEGTFSKDYNKLGEAEESIAAQIGVASSSEKSTVSVSGLSEYTDQLVDLMSDVLLHPAFPQDRFDKLKTRSAGGLAQRRSNAAGLAGDIVARTFYGKTPYARVAPTGDQIKAITRDDLVNFHAQYYKPNGCIIGVTGDVDTRFIVGKLTEALKTWQPGDSEPTYPAANFTPKESTKIWLIDRPNSAQTVLQFSNLALARTDPDYIPLVVANHILGGGSSARLFQNIREDKGYTYGAYSSLSAPKWMGLWGASANVRTEVTEPAVAEFFKEFKRIQVEPVKADELDRAKRSIIGSFARTLENTDSVLGRTLEIVEYGFPADYWDTYASKIEAVTSEDVMRVSKKYLGDNRIQLIAVGERSKIEEGLKKFGPLEVVIPESVSAGGGGRRGR